MKTDIVIVGTGVSGLYCALNLPRDKKIVMVTKADDDKSDSFLAQGGICVLKDENLVHKRIVNIGEIGIAIHLYSPFCQLLNCSRLSRNLYICLRD